MDFTVTDCEIRAFFLDKAPPPLLPPDRPVDGKLINALLDEIANTFDIRKVLGDFLAQTPTGNDADAAADDARLKLEGAINTAAGGTLPPYLLDKKTSEYRPGTGSHEGDVWALNNDLAKTPWTVDVSIQNGGDYTAYVGFYFRIIAKAPSFKRGNP